ncbi:MAG: NAD(P)/FAD-dependent oxidoreductase [Hyphomicrobiaceae bacterium]
MHVVVCGGGVIGAACAYALSQRGVEVTLIERWRIAGCASGKSGGFLARDWCDGSPLAPLAHRSFDLHKTWAEEMGNPYGYRPVATYGAEINGSAPAPEGQPADWLSPSATGRDQLGDTSTTAALDPAAFTQALVQAAIARGAVLRMAAVTGIQNGESGKASVVLEEGEMISADAIILALGPWSLLAAGWLPLPAVYGLKGHSIIYRPSSALPAEAIFAELRDDLGELHTPEIVSRADGTVYVCGRPGTGALPVDPSHVLPEEGGCAQLHGIAVRLVPKLASAEIVAEQACFRPVTADGLPLVGAIEGHPGMYVATGHSVWGMLNAPGTAEALAETLIDGASRHVDLTPFAPARLTPLNPREIDVQAG